MVVVGEITQISAEIKVSDKFSKKEVILRTVEQYPNHFKIEFINGNMAILDNWEPGLNVKISCNLRGRLYQSEDKPSDVFMSLVAWKLERA